MWIYSDRKTYLKKTKEFSETLIIMIIYNSLKRALKIFSTMKMSFSKTWATFNHTITASYTIVCIWYTSV